MDIVSGLTEILREMWDIVMRVFGGADTVSLVIMLVVVVRMIGVIAATVIEPALLSA